LSSVALIQSSEIRFADVHTGGARCSSKLLAPGSVPTLVVTAADDALARADNARMLAVAIPGARLFVDRGGHLLLRQAEAVGRAINEFIRKPGI
jgi:pimeloyl-ACP methyl ester carboxylesterase